MSDDEVLGVAFWFEWQTDSPFWARNDAARAVRDAGHFELEDLPLSEAVRQECRRLSAWYDTSLNWPYPPDPGPWRQNECERFNADVARLFKAACTDLGAGYLLVDVQARVTEDADLDAYLRDPRGFRR